MKKSELTQIIKEELEKVLSEKHIDLNDQGYGTDYYGVTSNIMEKWDELSIIKKDLKGYIESAHEAGGPKLAKEVMNELLKAVKESQPLLRKMRGSSEPSDVDLA
jgi:hypothetical protein